MARRVQFRWPGETDEDCAFDYITACLIPPSAVPLMTSAPQGTGRDEAERVLNHWAPGNGNAREIAAVGAGAAAAVFPGPCVCELWHECLQSECGPGP